MGFGFPDPIPPAADFVWLLDLIRRDTAPDERLLVQTRYRCEPLTIPLATGRETIGCSFPDRADPVQFTRGSLFGRRLSDWTAFQLNETVRRWGVSYAVTCTPPTEALFQDAFGAPCATNGAYHAFRTGVASDRFLLGAGRVAATVNRIELSGLQPADGKVVIRYRYHPAWAADGGIPVSRYALPDDPAGFIALDNPPPHVVLRFRPWHMLRAGWPQGRGVGP
jgi:hypothetical protein